MEENENNPVLISSKPLKSEFANVQKIAITCGNFTLGRSLKNSVCIPFLSISRNHCTFKKNSDNEWYVEDNSSLGIKINNERLGQGSKRKLEHEDTIALEPMDEFVYKFILPPDDVFETPRKRMKMAEPVESTIINNVRLKFEESQKCEIQHIEDKIQNAKQMQTTSIILKNQLQEGMNRKIKQLESEFSVQIENLKGEKNEVEKQKASLIEERDAQLANVKDEMEGKIAELMEQIEKNNETESELLKENGLLKDKLLKEREDFLAELNRESSSKQDMLDKLEAKIRDQEEVQLKERQELEDTLRRETEQLRLAKEKELKELEELKLQREIELQEELSYIKKNLADQVEMTEQQKVLAEQVHKVQMEHMEKLKAEEKAKMDQFLKEKEEIQKKLTKAQIDVEKSKKEIQARVIERETELAALAAERIQKQVDQSSEVISTLQEQLEKVRSQLQTVETEKNTLLENICMDPAEGTSKQETLTEFGELMESELQCSICAELFVEATTLNCSHTFCKYCICTWKKKKKDCPICRAHITSECKSLVLDSFIEKMVQSLTDEMKTKRQDMLKSRAAEVQNIATTSTSTRRKRRTTTTFTYGRGGGIATSTSRPRIPTSMVDMTTLPMPMNPAERPPILPTPMVLLRHPLLMGGQMTPVDHQTQAMDLQITRAGQILTDPTGIIQRVNRTDHPLIPTPRLQRHPHQESRQIQTDNLTRRQVQTVDLTGSPISQTTTELRLMPTGLIWMNSANQQSRQGQIENQTTSLTRPTIRQIVNRYATQVQQISTDPTVRQISTDPAEVQQISTVDGPMLSTNTTQRLLEIYLHSHQQVRQFQTENLRARRQIQTIDLTRPSISPTTTDPTQRQTEVRQTLTVDAPTQPIPMELTKGPLAGQTSTDLTEIGQRVNGADLNPVLLPILQRHPLRQGHQIETVDLTISPMTEGRRIPTVDRQISMNPADSNQQGHQIQKQILTVAIPMSSGERAPAGAPVRRLHQPSRLGQQGRAVVLTLEGGVVTSQASRASTTAGTVDASRAAPAATGPPAAPSDNQRQPSL